MLKRSMDSGIINRFLLALLLLVLIATQTFAGEADVIDVQIIKNNTGTYNFDVTVTHADAGWDHYVDKWEILDEKEGLLATRILHHPHVNEQPFMRSLLGVVIPESINSVSIRAHDSVHNFGGKVVHVKLP